MGLNHNPKIVTDGLVLALDAANPKSYPGSGTTWTDMSGLGNNGTTENSPTFDTSGFFTFNGTNQSVSCGNASNLRITSGSISAWFAANDTNIGTNAILTKQNAWGIFVVNNILASYDWGNSTFRTTGITVGDDSWYHVVMTFTQTVGTPSDNAKIYLNGIEVLTTTIKHSVQSVNVQIGGIVGINQFLSGKIAAASVYNTVLSAAEIQQNFNALRGRFGI